MSDCDDFFDSHPLHDVTRPSGLHGVRVDAVDVNLVSERRMNGVVTRIYSDRRARVVREETGDVLLDTGIQSNKKCRNAVERFLKKQVELDAKLYGQKLDTPS